MHQHKKNTDRSIRIANQIQRDLSEIIAIDLRDLYIKMITITEVRVTSDYMHAKIFFTSLVDDEKTILNISNALNKAAGFLRRRLSRRLSMRITPSLYFLYDTSIQHSIKMLHLIATL